MKSLAKNTIYNIIYKCLNIIYPLITSMYVSRILMPDGVGTVSYAQNIVSYFTIFAALGLPTYGIREIARAKENQDELNKTYSELLVSNFITTTISTIAFILFLSFFLGGRVDVPLYVATGVVILFNYLNIDWLYQGLEEYKYITVRSTIIKLLMLCSLFIFVRRKSDYIIYALISSLGVGGNYIFNIIHARKYVSITFKELNIKPHFLSIVIMGIGSIFNGLYSRVDITMIGSMLDSASVGYYTYAHRIVDIVINVCTSLTAVYLPRLSYYYATEKKKFFELVDLGVNVLAFLGFPLAIGLLILAPEAVQILYGPNYSKAILAVQLFVPIIIIKSFGDLICYQVAICTGKEKNIAPAYVVAAGVNVGLNFITIPIYGIYGAVLASITGEIIINIFLFLIIEKRNRVSVSLIKLVKPILCAIAMGIVVFGVKQLVNSLILKCFVCVSVGVIVYTGLMVIFKEEIAIKIVKTCIQRLRCRI